MSNCGCAGICSCEFINGETTIVEGNGRIATPFAVHLNNIPYPRPVGKYSRRGGSQAIPAGVATQVLFDNNDLVDTEGDVGGGTMDAAFAASVLTVPPGGDGIYLIGAFVEWAVTAAVATTKTLSLNQLGPGLPLGAQSIIPSTNTFGANNRCFLQTAIGITQALTAGTTIATYVTTGEATSIITVDTNNGVIPCWAYMFALYMGPS